jgi:hypothetical protein
MNSHEESASSDEGFSPGELSEKSKRIKILEEWRQQL